MLLSDLPPTSNWGLGAKGVLEYMATVQKHPPRLKQYHLHNSQSQSWSFSACYFKHEFRSPQPGPPCHSLFAKTLKYKRHMGSQRNKSPHYRDFAKGAPNRLQASSHQDATISDIQEQPSLRVAESTAMGANQTSESRVAFALGLGVRVGGFALAAAEGPSGLFKGVVKLYLYKYMHMCIQTHIQIYTCVYIYIYTYINVYIYIYLYGYGILDLSLGGFSSPAGPPGSASPWVPWQGWARAARGAAVEQRPWLESMEV